MRTVVIDASAIVAYLLRSDETGRIGAILETSETGVHVPALCDVEVLNVIRRAHLGRHSTHHRALEMLHDYDDLRITRHGHRAYLPRMFALRHNFSAYDATYVTLAEALDAELLTEDKRLAKAARRYVEIA